MTGCRSFNRALSHDDHAQDALFVLRAPSSARGADDGWSRPFATMRGRLAARFKGARSSPMKSVTPALANDAADPRQRAIVKIHYYKHAGGGGAALRAHGGYIERESAKLETDPHADYLSRDGRHGFFGPEENGIDGRTCLAEWSKADGRHFRMILSPEAGEAIGDLFNACL